MLTVFKVERVDEHFTNAGYSKDPIFLQLALGLHRRWFSIGLHLMIRQESRKNVDLTLQQADFLFLRLNLMSLGYHVLIVGNRFGQSF